MAAHSLSEEVSQAWARTRTGWQGEHADFFYEDYILKLQEIAERTDTLSARLSETNQALREALAAVSQEIND